MFAEAYLKGQRNMVESKSDLDRLKFMPQQIEGGIVKDFKGNTVFTGIASEDLTIFDAARVNDTKRCTSALVRDYFIALDKVIPLFNKGAASETTQAAEPKKEYGADILELVAAGDKKGLRALLNEYIEGKWANLDIDEVEDAADDIKACIANKDVAEAKALINDLICDDICEVKAEEATPRGDGQNNEGDLVDNSTPAVKHEPANEDEADLLQDLDDAVADEDYEDVELLLKELSTTHPRYAEFATKVPGAKAAEKAVEPEESEDDKVLREICEDLDAAIDAGDLVKSKDFLAELKTEFGDDTDTYKAYDLKVNPPKTTRRTRRG